MWLLTLDAELPRTMSKFANALLICVPAMVWLVQVSDGVVGCLAQLLYSKEAGLLQHACIALALVAQACRFAIRVSHLDTLGH